MKIKKWLSLPIIAGGLLAFVPYNYFSHHHKTSIPPNVTSYKMSYGKYLQDMRTRKSLANTNPMQLSAVQSDPPLLGYGYDLTNGTFSKKNAFTNIDNIGVKIIPLDSSYSFESITSQNQLSSNLGVDGSMSFGFKHFALSGAASFEHKTTTDSSDIHISFRMKTDVIELFDYNNKAQLSDKAKALVDSKDSTTFFNEYDAKYTTKLYATREVLFNLDMQLDSSTSKTDVKAKINFKKGLLSLEGAFEAAYGTNSSNSRISMSTLALPGGQVIYPTNSSGSINGDAYQRSTFLSDMQKSGINYVNLDDSKRSNPSNYFAKGISDNQLANYSYYYKASSSIVNPNIDELKEFPQLNQYYYLYENMVQDLNKLKQITDINDSENNNVFLIQNLTTYIKLLTPVFSDDDKNFQTIFKDHNLKPFETEFQNYNNIIFSGSRFGYLLKRTDWFLHIIYLNFADSFIDDWSKNIKLNVIEGNLSKIKNFQIFNDETQDNAWYSKISFNMDGNNGIVNGPFVFSFDDEFNINATSISYDSMSKSIDSLEFDQINSKKYILSNKLIAKSTTDEWDMNMIIDFSSVLNPDEILLN